MAMENSTYQLYFKNSKLLINSTSLNSDNVNYHLIKNRKIKINFSNLQYQIKQIIKIHQVII